ncbi:MAG: hypothetical protein WKF34_10235 [Pyrinomonadaceae bacterium]
MPVITLTTCPRCSTGRLKLWDELTDEQQMLAKRLPMSAEFPAKERKKHRFCTRCWYELACNDQINVA